MTDKDRETVEAFYRHRALDKSLWLLREEAYRIERAREARRAALWRLAHRAAVPAMVAIALALWWLL